MSWDRKLQNALARGRQFCAQVSIFEGSLAELLRFFTLPISKNQEASPSRTFIVLDWSTFTF
jgi:hypothetical protein